MKFEFLLALSLCFKLVFCVGAFQRIIAVKDDSVHLPCNITPPIGDDDEHNNDNAVRLVLWYKDESPQPIYSFDARFTTLKHWSENPNFGSRAFFRETFKPVAVLVISDLQSQDEGLYKCRVDFKSSPTLITKHQLTIINKPSSPIILSENGNVVSGNLGPFTLGDYLLLLCTVEGGKPSPRVLWYRDGSLIPSGNIEEKSHSNMVQNTLFITSLNRSYHNSEFTCKAENNNVTQTPMSSVKILMKMPANQILLTNLPNPLIANREYEVLCQVVGAQPLPEISWRLNDKLLTVETSPNISTDTNMISSKLLFTPTILDQNKTLSCLSKNVMSALNESYTLHIHYIPILTLESNDSLPLVVEGANITLKCSIDAHPKIWRLFWYKNQEELISDTHFSIQDNLLFLYNITKSMSGNYSCSASNEEGNGFSAPVAIIVNYKPICLESFINESGSGIDLNCHVDSQPSVNHYRWLFNSSDTLFEIPFAESSMTFTNAQPSSKTKEYGQVQCWASNEIGEQNIPCIFHVVPLGSPHPPKDCKITNYTSSILYFSCTPGFNGGLPTHFVIDVFETSENNSQIHLSRKISEDSRFLTVTNLTSQSNYIIAIQAVNSRGESSFVYLGGKTEELDFAPSNELANNANYILETSRLPFLFLMIGILGSLMIIGCLTTLGLSLRRTFSKSKENVTNLESENPSSSFSPLLKTRDKVNHLCLCSNTAPALPIQRTIVKTFTISKKRAICPVCNPLGNTPYPFSSSENENGF